MSEKKGCLVAAGCFLVVGAVLFALLMSFSISRMGGAERFRYGLTMRNLDSIQYYIDLSVEAEGRFTPVLFSDEEKDCEFENCDEYQILDLREYNESNLKDAYFVGNYQGIAWYQTHSKGLLISIGPDRVYGEHPSAWFNDEMTSSSLEILSRTCDPTNGTFSSGDIYRIVSLQPNTSTIHGNEVP